MHNACVCPNRIPVKEIERYEKHFFTQGLRSLLTPVSCLFPCSLYFSLQKSYEIISKSCCRRAHRIPPPRLWGVSVSASVACVPIASAKVRRISAPRKEMHKKSALFCEKRSQFRIPTLQTLSKPPFSGPFRGFPQGFWQESGRNALTGAGRGQENEGEGRGLLYIIRRKRGRERRKGHGRGQQKAKQGLSAAD